VNLWTLYVDYYPSGKKSLENGERRIRSVRVEKDRPVEKIPYKRDRPVEKIPYKRVPEEK